jgi:hypothetical protein
MRTVASMAAVWVLMGSAVFAASPKVESASKVFQSVAADPAKVKTYCEMSKVMESAGEKPDAVTDAKIQNFMTQLGPDFQQAWDAGNDLDENSADGKAYAAALDRLSAKCS